LGNGRPEHPRCQRRSARGGPSQSLTATDFHCLLPNAICLRAGLVGADAPRARTWTSHACLLVRRLYSLAAQELARPNSAAPGHDACMICAPWIARWARSHLALEAPQKATARTSAMRHACALDPGSGRLAPLPRPRPGRQAQKELRAKFEGGIALGPEPAQRARDGSGWISMVLNGSQWFWPGLAAS